MQEISQAVSKLAFLDFAMVHRAAKVDANQKEIVDALRAIGCTVQHLHAVGQGCPDLLVGRGQVNYLIEVKDGAKVKSAQKLTPQQIEWHEMWRGTVNIATCVDDAMRVVGGLVL